MREKIQNLEQFKALQEKLMQARGHEKRKILVCCGTGCAAGGNLAVYEELKAQMEAHGAAFELSLNDTCGAATGIKKSGCHGFCEMGPLVRIEPEGWLYTKVHAEDVAEIVEKTILGGEFIERGFQRALEEERQCRRREVRNVAKALEFVVGKEGPRHLDEPCVLRRFREDVSLVADVRHYRHYELFADRIDRRIRDLREELVEVVE